MASIHASAGWWIRLDAPALRRSRLSWVRQGQVRAEAPTDTAVAAAQNRNPPARRWGEGDVASADGPRFVAPIRTAHSGPSPRTAGGSAG